MIVFVYGSLKQGFHNHRLMEGATYVGEGTIAAAAMFSLGSFPAVVHGTGVVYGEMWEVSGAQAQALDRLEGHPTFYRREELLVELSDGELHTAWVYIYQGDTNHSRPIPSGDWTHEEVGK
tara:strand:+ start:223 stop:585 length:363 start_codon:yes stop_codon:yes gene_type:complete